MELTCSCIAWFTRMCSEMLWLRCIVHLFHLSATITFQNKAISKTLHNADTHSKSISHSPPPKFFRSVADSCFSLSVSLPPEIRDAGAWTCRSDPGVIRTWHGFRNLMSARACGGEGVLWDIRRWRGNHVLEGPWEGEQRVERWGPMWPGQSARCWWFRFVFL